MRVLDEFSVSLTRRNALIHVCNLNIRLYCTGGLAFSRKEMLPHLAIAKVTFISQNSQLRKA